MKKLNVTFLFALMLVMLAGCGGSSDQLVGNWTACSGAAMVQINFASDGHISLSTGSTLLGSAGQYTTSGNNITVSYGSSSINGTYSINGDDLTINTSSEGSGVTAFIANKTLARNGSASARQLASSCGGLPASLTLHLAFKVDLLPISAISIARLQIGP